MINILFCGNDGVFDGILTCMLSIFKRTKSKESFCFYIFTADLTELDPKYIPISDKKVEMLDRVAKEYGKENSVQKTDVLNEYRRYLSGNINEDSGYSPYANFRLLADIVEGIPDKLLYLDADILFNRDIELLYGIDIENCEYAAARDHYGKYLVNPNYINSGVLLLNMKEIRRTGLFEKSRAALYGKKLKFPDQTAIRKNTSSRKMLPQKFNDQKFLHKHTVVRHFSKRLFWLPYPHTANIKQWQVSDIHRKFGYYCFDDILYEYTYFKIKFQRSLKGDI